MAEREGFEPPVPARGTAVFKTAPFGRSGISPRQNRRTPDRRARRRVEGPLESDESRRVHAFYPAIPVSRLQPLLPEELPEHLSALRRADPGDHVGNVVVPRIREHLEDRAVCARLLVIRPVVDARDPRLDDRPRAHDAGLQGDEEDRLAICDSQPAQQGAFCVRPQFFADRMVRKGPLQKFPYIHLRKPRQ